MTAPDLPLEVQRRDEGAAVVVRVTGELDLATAPVVDAQLSAAQAALVPPAPLVLDLSDLGFMSSAGLALLLVHHRQCAERGSRLRVVTGQNRRVLRPVQISGLDTILDLVTTVADALPEDNDSTSPRL